MQQRVDERVVASGGNALEGIVEVVVVEREAEGKPANDEGRQFGSLAAPLLLGISLDEYAVDVVAAEFQGLFLQVGGLRDGGIFAPLLLYLGLRLKGSGHPPELIEGIHVEGKIVELPAIRGNGRIGVAVELHESIDVLPDLLVACVEDVCPVLMHVDALHLHTVDVASRMAALVNDEAAFPRLARFAGKEGTKKACAYNQIVVFSLLSHVRS